VILIRIKKLPDDDDLMIETCWSDFKCLGVTFELMFYYKQLHYLDHYIYSPSQLYKTTLLMSCKSIQNILMQCEHHVKFLNVKHSSALNNR
jgi:hypothetical protein